MPASTPAMTVRDVAAYPDVNAKTVYRLVRRAEPPGFEMGGTVRFQRADVYPWIRSRNNGDGASAQPRHRGTVE